MFISESRISNTYDSPSRKSRKSRSKDGGSGSKKPTTYSADLLERHV